MTSHDPSFSKNDSSSFGKQAEAAFMESDVTMDSTGLDAGPRCRFRDGASVTVQYYT